MREQVRDGGRGPERNPGASGDCGASEHRSTGSSRRSFLQIGTAGFLGLTLDHYFRVSEAQAGDEKGDKQARPRTGAAPRAQSVINIFLPGGLAAQESFDPKPFAPIEYRGDLRSIKTKIPGVHFSQHLGQTAKIADKLTIVRSMTHGEADHDRGVHNMFTGYRPSPALIYPSLGSIVSHELGPRKKLPPYVCLPGQPHTLAGSGFLSSAYAPFSLGSDPARGNFKVRDLERPRGVDERRFTRRQSLLEVVNQFFDAREASGDLDAMDAFYDRAYGLISSKQAREAFAIDREPKKIRDRYGRNAAGQRMLLARRLVEAGVRFVTLNYGGWDLHDNIARGIGRQLPAFDKAFATLIADLESRGLLSSTLVLVTTEFGRTPKINPTGGRDHWPKVFSIAMAGGGLAPGLVYGASDATSVAPDDDALPVNDWAATLLHLMGIDGEKRLMAPGNRPVSIGDRGTVRRELLA